MAVATMVSNMIAHMTMKTLRQLGRALGLDVDRVRHDDERLRCGVMAAYRRFPPEYEPKARAMVRNAYRYLPLCASPRRLDAQFDLMATTPTPSTPDTVPATS